MSIPNLYDSVSNVEKNTDTFFKISSFVFHKTKERKTYKAAEVERVQKIVLK